MNNDEVIRMARKAGFANVRGGIMDNGELSDYWDCWPDQLMRFAALVAAEKDKEIEQLRGEVEGLRSAYNTVAEDCRNLTEKVIPNIRAERDAAVADADLHRTRCASILFSEAMDDKLVSEVQGWVRDYVDAKAERDAAVKLLQAVLNIQDMSDADLEQLRLNCKAAIDAARGEA